MMQIIERARRKGQLTARMDCIAKDEMHYFTWLSIPLVKTEKSLREPSKNSLSRVISSWATKILTTTDRVLGSTTIGPTSSYSTTIEQLWINVRLFETTTSTAAAFETPRDRTSWAICAALKHVFEHGPRIIPTKDCRNDLSIDEVILNVVPPTDTPEASSNSESTANNHHDDSNDGLFIAERKNTPTEAVLKELIDVWNKLWAADEFKARYYRMLLEKIKRVRICVKGKTFRVRDLGLELERGQAERRRIDMRMR
jgi:hypothetical protein